MNINWVIAIVSPRDIALHPNFQSEEEASAPRVLATRFKGWHIPSESEQTGTLSIDEDSRQLLEASQAAFESHHAEAARSTLVRLATSSSDLAIATVSCLFAAVSLADADEYRPLFALLQEMDGRLADDSEEDVKVLRALIYLQSALRMHETNRSGLDDGRRALELVQHVDVASLREVETSAGVGWKSRRAWERVLMELERAAQSHVAFADPFSDDRSWAEVIRRELPPAQMESVASENNGFVRYISEQFNAMTRDPTITWASADLVDRPIVNSLTRMELIGSRSVGKARETLGQLRVLRADAPEFLDALRLLRQSGDNKVFVKAAQYMRANGPLVAVRAEANVVIRNRNPEWWRTVDLEALAQGGDLLDQPDAEEGFRAVRDNLHGSSGALSVRFDMDTRVKALGSLGQRAGLDNEMAELTLALVTGAPEDQLLLNAYSRLLHYIKWDGVSDENARAWRSWLATGPTGVDYESVRLAASAAVGVPADAQQDDRLGLGLIAEELNSASQTGAPPIPADRAERMGELLIETLGDVRRRASSGAFSFGGLSAVDLAVILATSRNQERLWRAIVDYLVDPTVPRELKAGAIDRLAGLIDDVPDSVKGDLHDGYEAMAASPSLHEQSGVFAAALRLGAVTGVEEWLLLSQIAQLISPRAPVQRVEAARTLDVLSWNQEPIKGWAYALLIQLCRDVDATVRAFAAHGLAGARVPENENSLMSARNRVAVELLGQDGIIVPQFTLQGIAESWRSGNRWITAEVAQAVKGVHDGTVSPAVRSAALQALSVIPTEGVTSS